MTENSTYIQNTGSVQYSGTEVQNAGRPIKFLQNSEFENLPGRGWNDDSAVISLAQLVDLNVISPLLDNLSRLCMVSCELIDLNGEILIRSLTENICENFHQKHPVTFANCQRTRERILNINLEREYEELTCQNGLTDVVIPIQIHGKLLGAFFIGPFFRKKNESPQATFKNQVEKFGFDEADYTHALKSVPVLTDEHSALLINVFSGLTNLIKSVALRDLAIANEIEARKIQENEKVIAQNKAEESDKLKSAFLANMSHEIRTPMNSIIGFSELMTRENVSEEDRLSFISIIKDSSQSLLELIDDIIDLSRIESGQVTIRKQNFDVVDMLNEVYIFFQEQAAVFNKSHIELVLDQPFSQTVMLFSDRLRVKQILSNLLRNAYKFSEKGTVLFGCRKQEEELIFYVKDSGIGIPKEQQDFIFERFRQGENNLTRKFGGAGLGLSIAKDLCVLLGGRIWLESEVDAGSIFCFSLQYMELKNEIS